MRDSSKKIRQWQTRAAPAPLTNNQADAYGEPDREQNQHGLKPLIRAGETGGRKTVSVLSQPQTTAACKWRAQLTRGLPRSIATRRARHRQTPYRNRGGSDRMLICSHTSPTVEPFAVHFIDHRGHDSRGAPECIACGFSTHFLLFSRSGERRTSLRSGRT